MSWCIQLPACFRRGWRRPTLALIFSLGLPLSFIAGCADSPHEAVDNVESGGGSAMPAPPTGAHAAHVESERFATALTCEACHGVDENGLPTGEISFGAVAFTDGAAPVWNGTSCTGVYCHGTTLGGGADAEPTWDGESEQVACGSCHGFPPPRPHPPELDCWTCHRAVVSDAGLTYRLVAKSLIVSRRESQGEPRPADGQ